MAMKKCFHREEKEKRLIEYRLFGAHLVRIVVVSKGALFLDGERVIVLY